MRSHNQGHVEELLDYWLFNTDSSSLFCCLAVSALTRMRRARPKSYVLATSTSLPETAFTVMIGRELSSLGSLSSIDRSSRSAQSHNQPQGHHRIQKFIALFSHQLLGGSRMAPSLQNVRLIQFRNSRTSAELALGKTGKRRSWDECWAVLIDQSLYLCPHEPRTTVAEKSGEKLIHLPPCARVDVHSSIIDIAYEWLAMSRTKHVIRLITQTRAEHLFELNSEADMLSWIATLQSCAEGTMSPQSETPGE
ncbi:PH domain protein [Cooperia oncophora]